jgi:hypothetical protein
MNIDKSNSAIPVGTDTVVVNRQGISEYTCTLEKLKGYKSYVALWSVSDEPGAIPTVVVLNNDFTGVTFNWAVPPLGPGFWQIVADSPVFTNNKTVCFFQNSVENFPNAWSFVRRENIYCQLTGQGESGIEFSVNNASLEIRVYN